MSASSDLSRFSPSFAEHLQQPPPEFLYHYTSQDGLLGIVKSGTLWSTNIFYMNDSTEFRQPLGMLRERVNKELQSRQDPRLKLLFGKLKKVRIRRSASAVSARRVIY
jgi:hypothetical protein